MVWSVIGTTSATIIVPQADWWGEIDLSQSYEIKWRGVTSQMIGPEASKSFKWLYQNRLDHGQRQDWILIDECCAMVPGLSELAAAIT